MLDAPIGWPTDFRDVEATCTVVIDGTPVAKATYSVNRTASSDLPAGLRIVAGVSTASAEVTINTWPLKYTFKSASEAFNGKAIQVYAGYSGVEVIVFTGLVYSVKGVSNSYEIELSCDDTRITARKDIKIPFMCADLPEDDWTELSGTPDRVGLSTLWVADRLMREVGMDSYPVHRFTSAASNPMILARVSNQGSFAPEYGTVGLISAAWNTAASGQITPDGGWGVVGQNGANWYNTRITRSNGTAASIRVGDWVKLTACIHGLSGGTNAIEVAMYDGATNEDYFRIRRDATGIYAERRVIATGIWTADCSLSADPDDFYIVSVIWRATSTAGQMTAHMVDNTGRTANLTTPTTRSWGSFNRISRLITNQADCAFIDLVSSTISNTVISHADTYSWTGEWLPKFKAFLPQLGSWDDVINLSAQPSHLSNESSDAWDNLRAIAEAEAALLLVNEDGQIEFHARSWIEGAVVGAKLTAREPLVERRWSVSMDQVRLVINVEYEDRDIQRAQRQDPVQTYLVAGRPSEPILIDGGQSRNVFIDLDGDVYGIDLSATRASTSSNTSFWYYANITDVTVWNGSNANDGTLTGINLTLTQLGSARVLAKVIRVATGVGTYTLSGRKGAPNSPTIVAKVLVQNGEGGTVTRGSDPNGLYQPFTASRTPWRQGADEANKYADWLEDRIAPDLPVQDIAVIANLLTQIGDIVEVEDPDDPNLIVKGGVVGIETAGARGSLTQKLQIRPISIAQTPPEGEAVEFDEFNAFMSGKTFDQINAFFDSINPTMTMDQFTALMQDGEI